MPAVCKAALQLLFASSALLSKFEPTLARSVDEKASRKEKKDDDLGQPGVLRTTRRKKFREDRVKGLENVLQRRLRHEHPERLKNIASSSTTNENMGDSCDPDMGILNCGLGEYCKKIQTDDMDHLGGVCVHAGSGDGEESDLLEVEHRRLVNVGVSGCNAQTTKIFVSIEADYYSNYNAWAVYNVANGEYAVNDRDFPSEAAVKAFFCVPKGDTVWAMYIYDYEEDGIDSGYYATPSGRGLTMSVSGYQAANSFINKPSGFFTAGYAVIYCFTCPAAGGCSEVECVFPTYEPTAAPTTPNPAGSGGGTPQPTMQTTTQMPVQTAPPTTTLPATTLPTTTPPTATTPTAPPPTAPPPTEPSAAPLGGKGGTKSSKKSSSKSDKKGQWAMAKNKRSKNEESSKIEKKLAKKGWDELWEEFNVDPCDFVV